VTPEELVAWRRTRGLNQGEVADQLGVSRQTIIRWERRQFAIPDDIHIRLERITTPHNVAERENENTGRITQMDYPALFDRIPGTLNSFWPNKDHPFSLALRGLLGWPGCTWRNATHYNLAERGMSPPTAPHVAILRTEHYAAALRDRKYGVEYHLVVAELLKHPRGNMHPVLATRYKLGEDRLIERSEIWEPWDGYNYWAEMPPVTD